MLLRVIPFVAVIITVVAILAAGTSQPDDDARGLNGEPHSSAGLF